MKKLTIILFLLFASLSLSQVINVPTEQPTIQAGIDAAINGDTVLVAEGTYFENVLIMNKSITLASHFIIDNDTSHISKTIIDGSQPINTDEASTVTINMSFDTSVLCGFTITGGYGHKLIKTNNESGRLGGGIGCVASNLIIDNNRIINNRIDASIVPDNFTTAAGGGIYISPLGKENLKVIIRNNYISMNGVKGDRTAGAGVYISQNSTNFNYIVENNNITDNITMNTQNWKAMGGGIYLDFNIPSTGERIIRNNIISNNQAICSDNYIYSFGGGMYIVMLESKADGSVDNDPGPFIYNNIISGNHSGYCGGGIAIWRGYFPNGSAYAGPLTSAGHYSPKPSIINNTIINNSALDGAGFFIMNHKPFLMNNILWNQYPDSAKWGEIFLGNVPYWSHWVEDNNYVDVEMFYNTIQGGWSFSDGEGNIDVNPMFADTLYNLSEESYCVGNGIASIEINGKTYLSPSSDFYDNPRPHPVDEFIDIGAIESEFPQNPNVVINVPGDYATIQAGIDAAEDGNKIIVAEGTYFENINFKGKAITVASHFILDQDTSHISKTILDGSQPIDPNKGSVVTFNTGEDSTSLIIGFTITGGTGTIEYYEESTEQYRSGGAIHISEAGGKIVSNVIVKNALNTEIICFGGGIAATQLNGNSVVVHDNLIESNEANSGVFAIGGGAYFEFELDKASGNLIFYNNSIKNNSILGQFAASGGGVAFAGNQKNNIFKFYKNEIANNSINSNDGNSDGGGLAVFSNNCEIRNNLIYGNKSNNGGGVYIFPIETANSNANQNLENFYYFSKAKKLTQFTKASEEHISRQILINNTVVNNIADYGSEISMHNCSPLIINSIVWNESSNSQNIIYGIPEIQYSCIQGGFLGIGNIDSDPLFIDNLYLLQESSPLIDIGHPDIAFNDLDGTRNDLGYTGGNPCIKFPTNFKSFDNNFGEFLTKIYSAEIYNRGSIVDSFMNTISNFPYIEDENFCSFIYRNTAQRINLAGDINDWSTTATPMRKIEGTDCWYYTLFLNSDARIEYKFVIDSTTWILDPLNPNKAEGGFGFNSELMMPSYIPPIELTLIDSSGHGSIYSQTFTSAILDNVRQIKIYTPNEYQSNPDKYYPLVLFHDGLDYLNFGKADIALNYLIHNKIINPLIAVFVPPISNDLRDDEYVFDLSDKFTEAIITELLPQIENDYRIQTNPKYRAMLGPSFAGNISTKICFEHPEVFGFCAPYSPAYWPNNYKVLNDVIDGPKKEINFYLDWGKYESDIKNKARKLKDALINKDYRVHWNEWSEGHNWWSWRAHIDEALIEFDFITDINLDEKLLPMRHKLSQNYPNPFNPSTVIKYQISNNKSQINSNLQSLNNVTLKVFDILGREVATLVNQKQNPGNYEVTWEAGNQPSGVYFYQLTAGDPSASSGQGFVETKKMILLR